MARPMILAMSGWYPGAKEQCKREIDHFIDRTIFIEGHNPVSCVVPHAGWFFSGKLAVNNIRLLKEKNGTIKNVFIFGGHLPPNSLVVCETFDVAQTPFGELKNNTDVLNLLKGEPNIQYVEYLQDNTIEILLPIVKYFFPNVNITAIYLPPSLRIIKLIEKIYDKFGQDSVFIGSTDLTHYGPNYNFYHNDKSIQPYDWVKNINDKGYVDLLLKLEGEKSIDYALKNKSACSSGAALGSVTVAKKRGMKIGHLLGYSTSYDVHKDDSFVGYAGIIY